MKLMTLTGEQEAAMAPHAQQWISRALEARPARRDVAERGIRAHYRIAGLPEPKRIVWTTSPIAAVIAGSIAAARLAGEGEDDADAVKKQWNMYLGGQMWSGWPAAYATFYRDVCGLTDIAKDALQAAEDVTECGWWWPHSEFVIVSERHSRISRDDNGRLHCATGPAIVWPDGWGIYAWHGTRVPSEWIVDKASLSARTVLHTVDMEVRRAGCEILGWDAILASLPHRVIDADPDPEIGTLLQIDLPDSPGERFVRARCGTGRWIFYAASPTAKTAREAAAESYSLSISEYRPEVRT